MYNIFSVCRVAASEFIAISQGLIKKMRAINKHNITESALFKKKGTVYFILSIFLKKQSFHYHLRGAVP